MSRNAIFVCTTTLILVIVLWAFGFGVWKTLVLGSLIALILHLGNVRDRAYRRQVGLTDEDDPA